MLSLSRACLVQPLVKELRSYRQHGQNKNKKKNPKMCYGFVSVFSHIKISNTKVGAVFISLIILSPKSHLLPAYHRYLFDVPNIPFLNVLEVSRN